MDTSKHPKTMSMKGFLVLPKRKEFLGHSFMGKIKWTWSPRPPDPQSASGVLTIHTVNTTVYAVQTVRGRDNLLYRHRPFKHLTSDYKLGWGGMGGRKSTIKGWVDGVRKSIPRGHSNKNTTRVSAEKQLILVFADAINHKPTLDRLNGNRWYDSRLRRNAFL